jgi:hypothetical protein
MKQNAFSKSLIFFKKNWITISLYKLISVIVLTIFSGYFISSVRKKMETVSDLQPVLHDTLNAIEQNDVAVVDASADVLNSLNAVTQEIIVLTLILLIGFFVIYSLFEGNVWRSLHKKKFNYVLKFMLVSLIFFTLLFSLLYFSSINGTIGMIIGLILIGWMLASYVKIGKEKIKNALMPGLTPVIKSIVIFLIMILFFSIALFVGGILIPSSIMLVISFLIAAEIALFLKIVLINWIK